MRKLLFFLLMLPVVAGAQLTIDTSKITKSDLITFLSIYELKETPKPEKPVGKIADYVNAYYASSSLVTDASGAITKLKAIKGTDLPYVGYAKPTLARPFLLNGEVVFMNQPNALFKVQPRENGNPFPLPEEYTIIFRKLPGTDWETLWNGWGDYYLGFGSGKIRILNQGLYSNVNQPPFFELTMLHVLVEDNKATIWVNGNKADEVTSNNIYRRLTYSVGAETNSADYNWHATMFIEKKMSDTERQEYFKAVKETYNIGSLPDLPYASNISLTNKNGKLTVAYKYNGKYAEDKSKVQYQWWKQSPDLGNQKLISTDASINTQRPVKVCVKVTDIKGNSWMFISGVYFEG